MATCELAPRIMLFYWFLGMLDPKLILPLWRFELSVESIDQVTKILWGILFLDQVLQRVP
jgi:hypothetical protein